MSIWQKCFYCLFVISLILAPLSNVTVTKADYQTSFVYEESAFMTDPDAGHIEYYSGNNGFAAMHAEPDDNNEGFMLYGPYTTDQLPGKRYRVTYFARLLNPSTAKAFQININELGYGVIAHWDIYGDDFDNVNDDFQQFSLDFTKQDDSPMEYRAWYYDQAIVEIDKVTVTEIPNTDSVIYESENLRRNIGSRVDDATASNGKAVKALASEGSDFMQFGPYTVDQEINNTYKATFKLKVSDNTSASTVARIDAANFLGGGEWSFKKINGTDFAAPNTWQDFTLIFNRVNEGSMEYRILTYGLADITADYVLVEKYTQSTTGYESELLFSDFGASTVSDPLASGGLARQATAAQIGALQYGPYTVDQAPGSNYQAIFRMSVSDHTQAVPIARIEALNSGGNGTWKYKTIYANDFSAANKYEDMGIDFTRTDQGSMEYRVFSLGNANGISFRVDKVDVYKKNNTDWTYEAENLFGSTGNIALDVSASGNKAREATQASNNQGYVVYGPYTDDQPINQAYTATFTLKTRNNSSTSPIAKIEVYNPGGEGVWVQKNILGTDFTSNNTYQNFDINFTRLAGGTIEYRVWFYDVADILVDKVVVAPFTATQVIYEAENMLLKSGVGNVVSDAAASNGQAVTAAGHNAICDTFPGYCHVVYGPYSVEQAPGNYQVTFRVKKQGQQQINLPLARVEIVNQNGTGEYVFKDLTNGDFNSNNYTDITLNFYRSGQGTMEYRVYTYNVTDITVDKITVDKI
ncbi:MAG: hypothetical protein WC570_02160 [Patescibacteria group bacterium]